MDQILSHVKLMVHGAAKLHPVLEVYHLSYAEHHACILPFNRKSNLCSPLAIIQCPDLKLDSNTFISTQNTTVGSVVKFSCANGYKPTRESVSITCQSDGTWTGQVPFCKQSTYTNTSEVRHTGEH